MQTVWQKEPVQHLPHPLVDLVETEELIHLPNSFDMMGQTWSIFYVENLAEARGELGLTDPTKHRIYIYSKQSKSGLEDTLCHELLHAYLYQMGMQTWIGDEAKEEQLVRFISPFIVYMVKTLDLSGACTPEEKKCSQRKKSKRSKS
jgi:hypothetical protein